MHSPKAPVVLTVAGSDSGGDAGIQADLRVFADFNVHGVTAITCLTAQNPRRITQCQPATPACLRAQLQAVGDYFPLKAAKTGMLFSGALIRETAIFFSRHPSISLVVDPVMRSTSGSSLLQEKSLAALRQRLLPLAAIVTPNIAEAEIILGQTIRTAPQARSAARELHKRFGCDALVKGGHLSNKREAVDFFHGRGGEWMLSSPRLRVSGLHGAGCTYSAAIAAGLANGLTRIAAVEKAKNYISKRIAATLSR